MLPLSASTEAGKEEENIIASDVAPAGSPVFSQNGGKFQEKKTGP